MVDWLKGDRVVDLDIHISGKCSICGRPVYDGQKLQVVARRGRLRGCGCGCDLLILVAHRSCLS